MTLLFRCTIPGRVCIKKNNLQRRYSFKKKQTVTMASDKYLAWQNTAVGHVKRQMWKDPKALSQFPLTQTLHAKYFFYFQNHHGEADTSNCVEGPQDVLTKAVVIKDDKFIKSFTAEKFFGEDPRTVIELYEYEGEQT